LDPIRSFGSIHATWSALAAKAATTTIPIVSVFGTDPVRSGLVSNLHRPGGNITGISGFQTEMEPKRMELLRELRPNAATIAVLVNPKSPYIEMQLNDIQTAQQRRATDPNP
jgi:putative ABC transport system substrate-binding protein